MFKKICIHGHEEILVDKLKKNLWRQRGGGELVPLLRFFISIPIPELEIHIVYLHIVCKSFSDMVYKLVREVSK